MAETHNIARRVCDEKINSEKPFSYTELCNKILKKGGVLRPYVGTTIGEYLVSLEEGNIIEFNAKENKFYPVNP